MKRKTKKKKAVKKKAVNKKTKKKKAVKKKVQQNAKHYKPIENFNPMNVPDEFIIVRFNHEMLDQMLKSLTMSRADEIGVPCKEE